MNVFQEYFSTYKSFEGFEKFHNEVINMPRDAFSQSDLKKVRTLASYLLLIADECSVEGKSYKYFLKSIKEKLDAGFKPIITDRNIEKRYFQYEDLDYHYGDKGEGRMFRHLMGLCSFFGLIESESRLKKTIVIDKCKEYVFSDEDSLLPVARNNLLILNAKDNDYIRSLKEISINNETDYQPTMAIIKYIKEMNRPVSQFELSILLGRIDALKRDKEIIDRAISIGKNLPHDISKQKDFFFTNMGWVDENTGQLFRYRASQQPDFKFRRYILYMESFELIFINDNGTIQLTDYSNSLLEDDVPYLIRDLENLLAIIDNSNSNSDLNDIILYQRNPQLLELAKSVPDFIEKMNLRSLRYPIYRNNKRVRNRLIAELAKIIADYKCEYADKHIFLSKYGKYYCEAHHILEFSTEKGPDIIDNLIVIGPEPHSLIHHAHQNVVDDFYLQMIKKGKLSFSRFENMVIKYQCLTTDHSRILKNKKIITSTEELELNHLIAQYGSRFAEH